MPADSIPQTEIPTLANRVSPPMLDVLRRILKSHFIRNGTSTSEEILEVLHQLTEMGLVDVAYDGDQRSRPYLWVNNLNGTRVLNYRTGIRGGPHYELPAEELAAWIETQAADLWWGVDGDPRLSGRITFPCPGDELSAELRKINRPLLVRANNSDPAADGKVVGRDAIDGLVGRFADNLAPVNGSENAAWLGDRILDLCWKDSTDEWMLIENRELSREIALDAQRTAEAEAGARK